MPSRHALRRAARRPSSRAATGGVHRTTTRAVAAASVVAVALLAALHPRAEAIAPTLPDAPAGRSGAGQPPAAVDTPYVVAANDSVAGEYLTIVGGCNDCHTPGWDRTNGKIAAADRFTGNPVGYRGPWGTSYAHNLRLIAQRVTEDRWVEILTTNDGGHGRPPMPYMNTALMSQRDLRAMHRYIRSLGAKGERAPRAVAPGTEPQGPYIWMVPRPTEAKKVTRS